MRARPVLAGAIAGAALATAAVVGGVVGDEGGVVSAADAQGATTTTKLRREVRANQKRVVVNLKRTNRNTKDIAALKNDGAGSGASSARVQGPQGAPGPQGPPGEQGSRGETGPQGAPGPTTVEGLLVAQDDGSSTPFEVPG